MARYIDKHELISWIVNEPSKVGDKDIPLNNEYDGSVFRQIEILGHIESMPTVDVVEMFIDELTKNISERIIQALEANYVIIPKKPVVRCKDCKFYNEDEMMCNDTNGFDRYWKPTDFCSYGERREDG